MMVTKQKARGQEKSVVDTAEDVEISSGILYKAIINRDYYFFINAIVLQSQKAGC
jgi:hypothetical protein